MSMSKPMNTASESRPSHSLRAGALLLFVAMLGAAAFAASAQAGPTLTVANFSSGAYNKDGSPNTKAGATPWEQRTSFAFNTTTEGPAGNSTPGGNVKDTTFDLPAGISGNPAAFPTCPQQLIENSGAPLCPTASQVGVAEVDTSLYGRQKQVVPVYNMAPPAGVPAQLAFIVIAPIARVDINVRSDGDYGIHATTASINATSPIWGVSVHLWGVPADSSHDGLRFSPGSPVQGGTPIPSGLSPFPFLRNPTSCNGPLTSMFTATSWQEPDHQLTSSFDAPAMAGCDQLDFEPTIEAQPSTDLADSPSGLDFHLHVPLDQDPEGTATANLRSSKVVLPPSLTVNPSSANGLEACTLSQIGYTGTSAASGEAQVVSYDPATVNSFHLSFEGQETPRISAQASNGEVRSALEFIPALAGNVEVTGTAGSRRVTFIGALAGTNALLSGTETKNPVESVEAIGEAGGFNLQFEGGNTEAHFEANFGNEQTSLEFFNQTRPLQVGELISGPGIVPGTKIVAIVGNQVEIDTQTTEALTGAALQTELSPGSSAAVVQTALRSIPALSGNVFVTSAVPGTYLVEFGGSLTELEPPLLTATSTLTGPGAGVTIARAPNPPQPLEVSAIQSQPGVPHFDSAEAACPPASKLATVRIDTPAVLAHPLMGEVFLATPHQNPFGSLLAIYIVAEGSGVRIKLPGRIEADPQTGRLTATVSEAPQLPFEDLNLEFVKGAAAPLKTGIACGTSQVLTDMVPWSAPQAATAHPGDSFTIAHGAGGGACVGSEAQAPNQPSFEAGTADPVAGSYSPFTLKLARADGTQQLTGIDTTLPMGLIAKLAGVPYCSDAALASAAGKDGKAEQASPSCPAASKVGSVTVGAGAGPSPFYAGGSAYLAGPYKGAPLSLAVVTPAVAGPFDLGTVVVRNALFVDPETAVVHAVSDPFPTILQGIPLDLRSVVLNLDRAQFTKNPTSCSPLAITGAALALTGQSAALNQRFQVGDCAKLKFAPKLALNLDGATKRTGHPALKAVLTYPKGNYANIAAAQVTLPHSEFLDQSHIRTVCTRVQFAAKACPKASIYGHAKAITPLLDAPLSGPVYLRSSNHPLPDLVVDLNGQIEITLAGRIDTGKGGGIRNTFQLVPDAPVSKFTLNLQGGKKGLLVNSENICRKPQRADVELTAQNGLTHDTRPLIANDCGGKSKKRRAG
jgi:hypothetical protein